MKKSVLITLFLSVILSLFSNQVPEEKIYEYNANCITVVLHGYWSKYDMNEFGDATGLLKNATQFKDVFEVRGINDNDWSGYFAKTTRKLQPYYDSVFAYGFSNGADKTQFKINGEDVSYVSDVFVRELGDFNYGSQVVKSAEEKFRVYKQCLIGMAKTEWVFTKYLKKNNLSLPDWSDNTQKATIDYKRLILSFGSFVSLLSKEYIKNKLNSKGGKDNLVPILNPTNSRSVEDIADEIYHLAWKCPDRINFIAHSMGGMFTLRYLNGYMDNENLYGYNTDRAANQDSIYQFYQNYTKAKYNQEKTYYESSNFFKSHEKLSQLNIDASKSPNDTNNTTGDKEYGLVTFTDESFAVFKEILKNDSGRSVVYWNEKIKEYDATKDIDNLDKVNDKDLIMYLMFVKERENSAYRVVTEDSPLRGGAIADLLVSLDDMIGDKGRINDMIGFVQLRVAANIILETLAIPTMIYYFFQSPPTDKIVGGMTYFVLSPLVLALDIIIYYAILFTPQIIDVSSGYRNLKNVFSKDSSELEEVRNDSPLVLSYKNKMSPPYQKSFKNNKTTDPVEITTLSFTGVPTPLSGISMNELGWHITMGLFQRNLINMGFAWLGWFISGDPGDNSPHMTTMSLFIIFSLMGIRMSMDGSFLINNSSARGSEISWLNNKNFCLYKSSENFKLLQDEFYFKPYIPPKDFSASESKLDLIKDGKYIENVSNSKDRDFMKNNYDKVGDWYWYKSESKKDGYNKQRIKDILERNGYFSINPFSFNLWFNGVTDEVIAVHQWNQNIMALKILMAKDSRIYFEGSPYLNLMSITNNRGEQTGKFEDMPYSDDPTRTLFSYIFLDNTNFTSLNNITLSADIDLNRSVSPSQTQTQTVSEDKYYDKFGNEMYPVFKEQDLNKGLNCNFNDRVLDYLSTPSCIKAMPVNLYNYYDGLKIFFSINSMAYQEAKRVADVDKYAENNLNADTPSLVFNDKGLANLVSPKFKEGFNTVTFKFVDPFGREVVKSMLIMQNLIPPFIKPLYPTMNQYIADNSPNIKIQAMDITQSFKLIKTTDWFKKEFCTLFVDDVEVPLSEGDFNYTDSTLNVNLSNLSDGNHTINVKVNFRGNKNERAYTFWVDTTAPDISFPSEKVIMSNADKEKLAGFGAYVKDTVPYRYKLGDVVQSYDVDTVSLQNVLLKVDGNYKIYEDSDTRFGMHSKGWNGYADDTQLGHGLHTLQAFATDRLGNATEKSTEFIVDNKAPVFSKCDLNTTLINTTTAEFQLDYKFTLDSWEKKGKVEVNFFNKTADEKFTMNTESDGNVDSSYMLSYFSEGNGVLKDGIYDISVVAVDEYGNKSTPKEFKDIIVDMIKPTVASAFTSPSIIKSGSYDTTIKIIAKESDKVDANKSSSLSLKLDLYNQYDEKVSSFNTINSVITPEITKEINITTLSSLDSGRYYFLASIMDKNKNTAKENIYFIKDAATPIITYPLESQIIDKDITIKGTVEDPRWDNNSALDHYEVYYRYYEDGDETDLKNLDLNNLSPRWLKDQIAVPSYLMGSSNNIGRFAVKEGAIAVLNASDLNNDLITVLLVAVEKGGYKIGSYRNFRIMHGTEAKEVSVNIDPLYADKTTSGDFNIPDKKVSITYKVSNTLDNPVDLFTSISDNNGKVVKYNSYLNMQSNSIEGEPSILSTDKGIYVWSKDGRVNVKMKNNNIKDSPFTVIISSKESFNDVKTISTLDSDKAAVLVLDNNKKIVCVKTVKVNETFDFSFVINNLSGMNFSTITDGNISDLYIGTNKQVVTGGNTTIFQGSEYPPIVWDGKDEWGRYVRDDVYTVIVEAMGSKGGHDVKKCYIDAKTPTVLKIVSVTPQEKVFDPKGETANSFSGTLNINKSCNDIKIFIKDSNNNLIKNIIPEINSISERGNFNFQWSGDKTDGSLCPQGNYDISVSMKLEDGSAKNFDNIDSVEIKKGVGNLNTSIQANLLELSGNKFNGKDLISGNTTYSVEIEPKGAYYPDKEIKLEVKGSGSQRITAYPQLDYLAAIRANYSELWGKIKASANITFRRKFGNSTVGYTYMDNDVNLGERTFNDYKLVSYNVTTNNFQTFTYNEVWAYSGEFTWGGWHDLKALCGIENFKVNTSVQYLKGNKYTTSVSDGDGSIRSEWLNTNDTKFTYSGNIYITTTVSSDYKTQYFSYCDAIAAMSPDIPKTDSKYAHNTDYTHKNYSVEQPLVDTENTLGTCGLPNCNETEVYRRNRNFYFYGIGETYNSSTDSTNSKNLGVTGGLNSGTDSTKLNGLAKPILIKDYYYLNRGQYYDPGYFDPSYTSSSSRGSVDFKIKYGGDNKFYVKTSTGIEEQISYPYPKPNGINIYSPHTLNVSGFPITEFNRMRVNGNTNPYYYVDTNSGIIENSPVKIHKFDFLYNKTSGKYEGGINYSEICSLLQINSRITLNKKEVISSLICNKGTKSPPIGVLTSTDVLIPTIIDGNKSITFEPQFNDSRFVWNLTNDSAINSSQLIKSDIPVDLKYLAKEGLIEKSSMPDFYSPTSTFDNSMFILNPQKNDNNKVIIKENFGDYKILLKSIDGNIYQGIELNKIDFSINEKLLHNFSIKLSKAPPKQLVAIYGTAVNIIPNQSYYKIEFYNKNNNLWTDIPIYNYDLSKKILTYWDIRGLTSGIYTLRLTSYNNSGKNVTTKEIYIGKKYEKSIGDNQDVIYDAPHANAQILFPTGSFAEDTLVDITPIDIKDIKDIAILPDFSPVGKIIKLSPEGALNKEAQLKFLYNKEQLVDIDINNLTIYNLEISGKLTPLNTIRKYFKYNSENQPIISNASDFVYVELWAPLQHFSYYCLIEGNVNVKPVLDQKDFSTNQSVAIFSGRSTPNSKIYLYYDDDLYFIESSEQPQKWAETTCNASGQFVFNNVPIPNERKNFYFFGSYGGTKSSTEVSRLLITRDTIPPEISVNSKLFYLSPNKDGVFDNTILSVGGYEKTNIRINIFNPYNELVLDTVKNIDAETKADFLINPLDRNNNPWKDGKYTVKIFASDEVNNIKITDDIEIYIDTSSKEVVLSSLSPIISSMEQDGNNDNLQVALNVFDPLKVNIWVIDENENEISQIFNLTNLSVGENNLIWNGKDSNNNFIPDKEKYYLKFQTIDYLGNKGEYIFNKTFTIDNKKPTAELKENSSQAVNKGDKASFNYYFDEPVILDFSISKNNQVMFSDVENVTVAGYFTKIWETNINHESGDYILKTNVKDMAGNSVALDEWVFKVLSDDISPITTVSYSGKSYDYSNTTYVTRETLISLSSFDNDSGVNEIYYSLDGIDYTYKTPLNILLEGEHILEFWSIDKAGNSENHQIINLFVDNLSPIITIQGIESDTFKNSVAPIIIVTDQIIDNYTITLNGVNYISGTEINTPNNYTIKVNAIDKVGNYTEKTVQFSILNEYMPEVKNIDFYFENKMIKLVWDKVNIVGLKGYNVYINNIKVTTTPTPFEKFSYINNTGDKSIQITSVDKLGNESKKSTSISIFNNQDLTFYIRSFSHSNGNREIRLKGIGNNCKDVYVEYTYLENGRPRNWTKLINGEIKSDSFEYIYNLKESDLRKIVLFRIIANVNNKISNLGATIEVNEKYFK